MVALPVPLTVTDAPAIRSLIRADLGVSDVSDAVVGLAFRPATQQVFAIDTHAASWAVDSIQAERDHDAAVLYAAAFLIGTVPLIVRESFQGYSYAIEGSNRADKEDYAANRAEALRELAAALLALNLGETLVEFLRPTAMALAPGGRGDITDIRFPNWRLRWMT